MVLLILLFEKEAGAVRAAAILNGRRHWQCELTRATDWTLLSLLCPKTSLQCPSEEKLTISDEQFNCVQPPNRKSRRKASENSVSRRPQFGGTLVSPFLHIKIPNWRNYQNISEIQSTGSWGKFIKKHNWLDCNLVACDLDGPCAPAVGLGRDHPAGLSPLEKRSPLRLSPLFLRSRATGRVPLTSRPAFWKPAFRSRRVIFCAIFLAVCCGRWTEVAFTPCRKGIVRVADWIKSPCCCCWVLQGVFFFYFHALKWINDGAMCWRY